MISNSPGMSTAVCRTRWCQRGWSSLQRGRCEWAGACWGRPARSWYLPCPSPWTACWAGRSPAGGRPRHRRPAAPRSRPSPATAGSGSWRWHRRLGGLNYSLEVRQIIRTTGVKIDTSLVWACGSKVNFILHEQWTLKTLKHRSCEKLEIIKFIGLSVANNKIIKGKNAVWLK